jgi:hypothetical protein
VNTATPSFTDILGVNKNFGNNTLNLAFHKKIKMIGGLGHLNLVMFSGAEVGTSTINWAELSRLFPEDEDRIQPPKCYVLNKKQDSR